jgi:phytoene desaturase
LGIAHTLGQTAVFRPSQRSRKVKNLFYAGQYTHPGVGVPMTFISSKIITESINRELL